MALAVAAITIVGLLVVVPSSPAHAVETYMVTTAADGAPGESGVSCPAANGNDCTLRAALRRAELDGADSTVTFDPSLDGLPLVLDDSLGQLESDGAERITVDGSGQSETIVDGGGHTRLLQVNGEDLVVEDLTFQNGDFDQSAGAIQQLDGQLTLRNVTVQDSAAGTNGGALTVSSLGVDGTTIENSTFTNNTAGGMGGAIHAESPITITGTSFDSNTSGAPGGAIYTSDGAVITNSAFTANTATGGGAVWIDVDAAVTLEGSTFVGNVADHPTANPIGGAIGRERDANQTLTVRSSTFDDNRAIHSGGSSTTSKIGEAIGERGPNDASALVVVEDSTFALTSATADTPQTALQVPVLEATGIRVTNHGEGIRARTLNLVDSTLAENRRGVWVTRDGFLIEGTTVRDNTSASSGGGIFASGAGVIRNSTVSNNESEKRGGGIYVTTVDGVTLDSVTLTDNVGADGDAIHVDGGDGWAAGVTLVNSIVTDSCAGLGDFTSGGHNLPGDVAARDTCGLADATDLAPADPQLEALAGNGGPTMTHALAASSPAVDAGATDLSQDQRGEARPVGSADDVGAFELQDTSSDDGTPPPPSSPTNTAPTAADDTATTVAGHSVIVDVLTNDTDPDEDDLTIDGLDEQPAGGTAEVVNGRVLYSPGDDFVGEDAFTYTASDGNGGTDSATVTVTVVPSMLAACEAPDDAFGDDTDSVHAEAIDCLAVLGLVHGYPDGTFQPTGSVTRGQAAGVLLPTLEQVSGQTGDRLCPDGATGFPDAQDTTFAEEIGCLASLGVLRGYPDGTFRPLDPVTRGQIASLLARAAVELGYDLPDGGAGAFDDVGPDGSHARAIASLHGAGVLEGFGDGTYRPAARLSRGQLASAVNRLLAWMDIEDPIPA